MIHSMSREEEQAWLQSLKAGDEVCTRYGWDGIAFVRVTKVTPTQIEVSGGARYRKKDGREIGNTSRYHFNTIEPVSQAIRDEIEERSMRRRIVNIEFKKLPIETIKQVLALVEPVLEEQEKKLEQMRAENAAAFAARAAANTPDPGQSRTGGATE